MPEKAFSRAPLPKPDEAELLVYLSEEATAVAKRASKTLRFGLGDVQCGQEKTNKERLRRRDRRRRRGR